MVLKITSKRQVTFPKRVLDTLGVGPGDRLELVETETGYVLTPRRVDRSKLAPLKDRLRRGKGSFDIAVFRSEPHDPALRD